MRSLVNLFEVYRTPIAHYQRSYERICKFIQKDLLTRIIENDDGQTKYIIFKMISCKGSALFKDHSTKLEEAFGKLDIDEVLRLETEKIKGIMRKDLSLKMRVFKEFID